jgi:hypothetical protein
MKQKVRIEIRTTSGQALAYDTDEAGVAAIEKAFRAGGLVELPDTESQSTTVNAGGRFRHDAVRRELVATSAIETFAVIRISTSPEGR